MFRELVTLLIVFTAVLADKTCEDLVTAQMKMKLVKDSLNQVKGLFPRCRDSDDENTGKCSKRDTALAHMNLAIDTLDGLKITGSVDTNVCPTCPDFKDGMGPADCLEVMNLGYKKNGVYTIYPRNKVNGTKAVPVYCDMETDGGGWTVFQRRHNYSSQTNFYRTWDEYKEGFGDVDKDFWLGNEHIFALTNQGVYTVRMDMKRADGEYRYNTYAIFYITDEESDYSLFVQEFKGNASNDFHTQHLQKFTTKDRPLACRGANDQCTKIMHGAWWYPCANCGHINLNGMYLPGVDNPNSNWYWNWTGYRGLLFSEMKIRPRNYKPTMSQ